ncbi:sulfotransferase [Halieaceae bacterium IMCC14734]|uniref:Sulfotransferase n=1 Tax=Candidatus Litorirhabdus singularis TaxID=2518993 RepID=A0ABT3TBT6_9GAMM|nr:sulfotransferase [Candidatus Litorirhabdus singularis]MCX2979310.1 sulfotransferase [Candidatus Litorirhabdus singularis]
MQNLMARLKPCAKFIDWIEPLHETAIENTGLTDFGEDQSYLIGLNKLLEQQDEESDLQVPVGYALKLLFVLEQRLKAEQRFKHNPGVLDINIEKPLVITGMVRTGSTAMQHLAGGDPNRQHLQYWMSEYPQPRPPREAWAEHPDFVACQARLDHLYSRVPETKAMHFNAADIPDECAHLMAQTFTDEYWQICSRVPLYNEWYEHCDMVPTYKQHRKLLQLIACNEPEKPWTIKYPVHLKHLKSFLKVYPDARIIWTHRDPASVLSSYTNMNATNRAMSVRPETLDREDLFHEQMEVWADATARAVEVRKQYPDAQFVDVHFDEFVAEPVQQMKKAYTHLGIEWTEAAEQGMTSWHLDHPRHKHGKHRHSGVSGYKTSPAQVHERFSTYLKAIDVRLDQEGS